jgi:GNAT superfamily N-acetyltransferase
VVFLGKVYKWRCVIFNMILKEYVPEYAEGVREVCRRTFDKGDPISKHHAKPFVDMVLDRHLREGWGVIGRDTDCEDSEVVGYMLGARPGRITIKQAYSAIELLTLGALGRFKDDSGADEFSEGMRKAIAAGIRGKWKPPRTPKGVPEVHMNIDEQYRGTGMARLFLELFESQCRKRGIPEYYGIMFSNEKHHSESTLMQVGFSVYDRVPARPNSDEKLITVVKQVSPR